MAVIILVLAFVLSLIIELPEYVDRYRKNKTTKSTQIKKGNVLPEHN